MTPQLLRNLNMLTAEAERKIRSAGRTPPPAEYLMAALYPHARIVTRAAKALAKAERQAARARVLAKESAASAVQMADAVAGACIGAIPAEPKFAEFDPAKFTVILGNVPARRTEHEQLGSLS